MFYWHCSLGSLQSYKWRGSIIERITKKQDANKNLSPGPRPLLMHQSHEAEDTVPKWHEDYLLVNIDFKHFKHCVFIIGDLHALSTEQKMYFSSIHSVGRFVNTGFGVTCPCWARTQLESEVGIISEFPVISCLLVRSSRPGQLYKF